MKIVKIYNHKVKEIISDFDLSKLSTVKNCTEIMIERSDELFKTAKNYNLCETEEVVISVCALKEILNKIKLKKKKAEEKIEEEAKKELLKTEYTLKIQKKIREFLKKYKEQYENLKSCEIEETIYKNKYIYFYTQEDAMISFIFKTFSKYNVENIEDVEKFIHTRIEIAYNSINHRDINSKSIYRLFSENYYKNLDKNLIESILDLKKLSERYCPKI